MAHLLKGRRLYPELNQQGSQQASEVNQPTTQSAASNPFMKQQEFNPYQHTQANYGQQGGYYNPNQQHYQQEQFQNPNNPYANPQTTQANPRMQNPIPDQSYHQTPQNPSSVQQQDVAKKQQANLGPKRKPSKSKQIDSDKIPRPEFNSESSYAPKDYLTTSYTNPPPSYWNYITRDEGCAGPRYARASLYKVPVDESLLNSTQIPFGIILQPFADPTPDEETVPVVNYGEQGPFRCTRCRAYVSPHWMWTQGGASAVCNLCKMTNAVPKEYYCPTDETGLRRDRFEKPELCRGVYEFAAPSIYSNRAPVTSNIIICLDVSSSSYLSGIFHQVLSSLQSLIDYVQSPELTKICIATYDTALNLFLVPDDLTKEPTVVSIPEIDDPCVPLPIEAVFLNVQSDREKIDYLIQKITKYYESNEKLTSKGVYATCFGAALNSCCNMLFKDGGRVLIFASQAPVSGFGKIKRRDDYKLYGTDKEKTLYVPQVDDYDQLAKKCLEKRVCVDLFCYAPEYFDLATIGQVCNLTGGNIYYYPNYNGNYDGEKLHYDLARNLTRYVGYDVVMTVRTSQGLAFSEYVLPTGRRPIADLELSALDADHALAVYFKHEDKLPDEDDVNIQAAVLYTNPYGERMIRVINVKLNTSKDLVNIFRSADVEAVAQLLIKKYIVQINSTPIKAIRDSLTSKLVDILYNYRIHCATSSSPAQLILPESLKVLPIYIFAIFKAHMLRISGEIKPDERSYDLHKFTRYPCNVLSNLWYPKLISLHDIYESKEFAAGSLVEETQRIIVPANIAATDEKIDDNGIYLLDNNETIYIYVRKEAEPELIQSLFGVESFEDLAQLTAFPQFVETDYFYRVNNIIDSLRKYKNGSYQNVRIIPEKDPMEAYFMYLLMEDERGGPSYSAYLCDVHKMIQSRYN